MIVNHVVRRAVRAPAGRRHYARHHDRRRRRRPAHTGRPGLRPVRPGLVERPLPPLRRPPPPRPGPPEPAGLLGLRPARRLPGHPPGPPGQLRRPAHRPRPPAGGLPARRGGRRRHRRRPSSRRGRSSSGTPPTTPASGGWCRRPSPRVVESPAGAHPGGGRRADRRRPGGRPGRPPRGVRLSPAGPDHLRHARRPPEDQDRFKGWSTALAAGLDPDFLLTDDAVARRDDAVLQFAGYFFELLAERRRHPGDDLLSRLVEAEDEGTVLSEGELLATCILLLVAGHETTVNLISGGIARPACATPTSSSGSGTTPRCSSGRGGDAPLRVAGAAHRPLPSSRTSRSAG